MPGYGLGASVSAHLGDLAKRAKTLLAPVVFWTSAFDWLDDVIG